MNMQLEQFRKTLQENNISVDESYIQRGLERYGYEEFPKSGLNGEGTEKLINTIIEIENEEACLTLKKSAYLKRHKFLQKPERQKKTLDKELSLKNIEAQFYKEDILKVGKRICKMLAPAFLMPTRCIKELQKDGNCYANIIGFLVENMGIYVPLVLTHSKITPYMITAQITTNIADSVYEWCKNVKTRAEEVRKRN